MNNIIKFPVIAGVDIVTDEQGRFNLNALHKASGGEKKNGPSYWLALDSTKALIDEISNSEDPTDLNTDIPVFTSKGKHGGTFAHELLAVSYAGWISPAFQLKVNKTFIDYKTGQTAKPETALSRMDILKIAMEAEEERQRLLAKTQEDAPKVAFHDKVIAAPDAISVSEAAKILGTGRRRLFAFLRHNKWVSRYNEPYQSKIEAGLMDVKLGSWEHPDHGIQKSVTALITGKGLAKLQAEFCQAQEKAG